ncbi:Protein of uncharacterised function (DUF2931) [Vibrio cholerae]|nr:Protein of uncharacterised function (DUF2931) [Vibrio cholerae]
MINKGELLVSARQKIALLLSVLLLNSCSTNAAYQTEQPWTWRVGVTMPSFYPVKITQIYGVNEKENWTVLIHNIIPRMSDSDIEYIRNRFPEYDGFGLPHALGITSRNQIGIGTNHLPDTLYVHWVSLFDNKFYVTKYDIPDNVKQLSATEVSYTRSDGAVFESCYRTRFVFGLLPNGRAKVWLSDCGETIYLTELAPDQTPDRDSKEVAPNFRT